MLHKIKQEKGVENNFLQFISCKRVLIICNGHIITKQYKQIDFVQFDSENWNQRQWMTLNFLHFTTQTKRLIKIRRFSAAIAKKLHDQMWCSVKRPMFST